MTRWPLLVLALAISGCSLLRVNTPPAVIVQPEPAASTPADVALAGREMIFAINTLSASIDAAVASGQMLPPEAVHRVWALRQVTTEVERLSGELALWSKTTDAAARAEMKARVNARMKTLAWVLLQDQNPEWRPLLDAYVRMVGTAGGAR